MNASDLTIIPLFSALDLECRQKLAQLLILRELAAGQNLILEGEKAEACYFIASGVCRALRLNPNGKVQVLSRLNTGEPINVISLLMPEHVNRATVEALTPASFLALTARDFDDLLESCPAFTTSLLRHFALRLSHMADLASELSLLSVRARLARFLVHQANEPEGACDWTQDEIAAQIGTVRDVIGRTLRDFETQGLISRNHQNIILLDRTGLLQAAGLLPN